MPMFFLTDNYWKWFSPLPPLRQILAVPLIPLDFRLRASNCQQYVRSSHPLFRPASGLPHWENTSPVTSPRPMQCSRSTSARESAHSAIEQLDTLQLSSQQISSDFRTDACSSTNPTILNQIFHLEETTNFLFSRFSKKYQSLGSFSAFQPRFKF